MKGFVNIHGTTLSNKQIHLLCKTRPKLLGGRVGGGGGINIFLITSEQIETFHGSLQGLHFFVDNLHLTPAPG